MTTASISNKENEQNTPGNTSTQIRHNTLSISQFLTTIVTGYLPFPTIVALCETHFNACDYSVLLRKRTRSKSLFTSSEGFQLPADFKKKSQIPQLDFVGANCAVVGVILSCSWHGHFSERPLIEPSMALKDARCCIQTDFTTHEYNTICVVRKAIHQISRPRHPWISFSRVSPISVVSQLIV